MNIQNKSKVKKDKKEMTKMSVGLTKLTQKDKTKKIEWKERKEGSS